MTIRRLFMITVVMVVSSAGLAVAQQPMAQNSPFAETIMNWQNYANAGDTTSIRTLYQDEAVALVTEGNNPSPGMIQGADNIVADLGQHFGPGKPYQNLQLLEVASQQGNSNWSYGTWSATVTGSDGTSTQQQGSWSVIWVQGSGSTPWLIQVFVVVPYLPGT